MLRRLHDSVREPDADAPVSAILGAASHAEQTAVRRLEACLTRLPAGGLCSRGYLTPEGPRGDRPDPAVSHSIPGRLLPAPGRGAGSAGQVNGKVWITAIVGFAIVILVVWVAQQNR